MLYLLKIQNYDEKDKCKDVADVADVAGVAGVAGVARNEALMIATPLNLIAHLDKL